MQEIINAKEKMRTILPGDLLQEGAHARELWGTHTIEMNELIKMVSDTILTQVLFALWDDGFYEYLFEHPQFNIDEAAKELELDCDVLKILSDYLVSRNILQKDGKNQLQLTEKGALLTNCSFRGALNMYLGGYGKYFNHLSSLLRKGLSSKDIVINRSLIHVGLGTEQNTCSYIFPSVLRTLSNMGSRTVLDIGCGAGGFLIQSARLKKDLIGIGVDMSQDSINEAQENAKQFSVADRLSFFKGKVGTDPLPIKKEIIDTIDVVTAMFILHELGLDSTDGIVSFLKEIKQLFPGKMLIFLEMLGIKLGEWDEKDPVTYNYSLLDYHLVHLLSSQGKPRKPAEWREIIAQAGLKLIDFTTTSTCGIYTVKL